MNDRELGKATLSEWFNINDKKHIEALQYWIMKKEWPAFFLPRDVDIPNLSKQIELIYLKIVKAWIKQSEPAIRHQGMMAGIGDTDPENSPAFGGYDG